MNWRGQHDPDTGLLLPFDLSWQNPLNWEEGAVPTLTDDAVFDADSPDCHLEAESACARLVVAADYPGVLDTAGWSLQVDELNQAVQNGAAESAAASQEKLQSAVDSRRALADAALTGRSAQVKGG